MQTLAQSGLEVRFFGVDIGGKPGAGAHVQAPAVEVEEEVDFGLRIVAAVKADDVVILIFDPDSAHEARDFLAFLGLDIDDEAAEFAKKFAAHEGEVVVLLLEIGVEHDHLGEAHGQKVQGVDSGQLGEHAVAESGLADERNVFGAVGHIEAAEEVLIVDGRRISTGVVLQVLQVGFDHGVHVAHLRHEEVLALHDAVEDVIEGESSCRKRLRGLRGSRGGFGRSGSRI